MQVILEVTKGLSLVPPFEVTGFVQVNTCKECKAIGYYSDLSRFEPCINCGGYEIVPCKSAGKLIDGIWHLRHKIIQEPEFYNKEEKKEKKNLSLLSTGPR